MHHLLLIVITLLLASCNWAEPPLPTPNAERDPRLIGTWHARNQKLSLRVSPLEEKQYRVTIEGESLKMEFTGYHTDVEGIKIISLELKDARLGEQRAQRWLLMSYEFAADGSFSPKFLSREVLPPIDNENNYIKYSGNDIYTRISGAAKIEHFRTRFFDTATEKISFEKETN